MRSVSDNVCQACKTVRKKKLLVYTGEYVPYCSSYWICNDEHPQHPKQKLNIKLYSYDEMQNLIQEQQPNDGQFIKQLMNKPFSVRIQDYKTIIFLMDLQRIHKLGSFSDALRYCIDFTAKNLQDGIQEEEPKVISKPEPETEKIMDESEFTF